MTELFNRVGSITVEVASGGGIPATGLDLKGLRFSFNIDKNTTSNSNSASFQIYNLAQQRRALFEEKGTRIICKLGWAGRGMDTTSKEFLENYDKYVDVCYVGEIIENGYKLEKNGADTVVSIQCGTASATLKESSVNKSYGKGTDVKNIVTDIAGGMGLKANFFGDFNLGKILNGFTASGAAKAILDTILPNGDLTWSIEDDELVIGPVNTPTGPTAILITPRTGLLGTPTKTKDGLISFRCLLNTNVKPKALIKLESSFYSGLVVPVRVQYEGDFDGGAFDCVVEAEEA